MEALALLVFIIAMVLQPKPEAPPDRVILLPDADGKVGRVVVSTPAGSQEIAQAYGAVSVGAGGAIVPYQESEASVKARHSDLLAARPKTARSYLLYFKSGGNELTPESLAILDELKRDAEQRAAVEIRVIGHTDRVGSAEANESLSLRRAQAIVQQLTAHGIRAQSYEAVGRGEMDPLVPTADGVSEPKNRRVEVSLR